MILPWQEQTLRDEQNEDVILSAISRRGDGNIPGVNSARTDYRLLDAPQPRIFSAARPD
jgi:hypothetical protein